MIAEADLDAIFAALADPTRRSILATLARGEASVMELAEPFDMSQPAITKHLNVLERAGLITRRRDGQRRPCKLEPKRLEELARWLGTFQEFWEDSFSRMDDYLEQLQRKEKTHARTDRSDRKPR
jgi:DNA-binding transcriptional ArsR family regulator